MHYDKKIRFASSSAALHLRSFLIALSPLALLAACASNADVGEGSSPENVEATAPTSSVTPQMKIPGPGRGGYPCDPSKAWPRCDHYGQQCRCCGDVMDCR
jgi:hypothetical protein